MKTRNLLLTSVLTISVFGLFGAVLTSSLIPGTASAAHLMAGHLSGGSMHGGHVGGSGRWQHGCNGADERMIELASAWVSISLDLSAAQEEGLAPLLDVIERWHGNANVFCEPESYADAPTALKEMNTLLISTQAAMDELIPAFEHFYATLTEEQQARLNGWITDHHGHRS